jgi:hypothetical protein
MMMHGLADFKDILGLILIFTINLKHKCQPNCMKDTLLSVGAI